MNFFYLAEVKRLFCGGKLFLDNYQGTQYYTPLILPFYSICEKILGGTEGVILAVRQLRILLTFLISIWFFWTLYKSNFDFIVAFCSFFVYLFYSKDAIRGLSYYTFALDFMMIGLILLFNIHSNSVKGKITYIFTGITFACSALCNPILAFFYILISIFSLPLVLTGKIKFFPNLLLIWSGTILTAAFYFLFIYFTSDISNMFAFLADNIAFTSGIDKADTDLGLKCILTYYKVLRPWAYAGSLHLLTIVIAILIKCRKIKISLKMQNLIFLANFIICIINMCAIKIERTGAFAIPLLSFAIVCAFLNCETYKLIFSKLSLILMIPGVILGCAFYCASNTASGAATIGFVLSVPFSVFCINEYVKKYIDRKTISLSVKVVLIASLTGISFGQKCFKIFKDDKFYLLNTKIEQGAAKGILTSKKHAELYSSLIEDFDFINSMSSEKSTLFITPMYSPGYLDFKGIELSPNSWVCNMNSPQADKYFDLHDMPDFVYRINSQADNSPYFALWDIIMTLTEDDINSRFYQEKIIPYYTEIKLNEGLLFVKKQILNK